MSKMSNLGFTTKFPKFTEITPEPIETEARSEANTPKIKAKRRRTMKPKRRGLKSGHIRTRVGGYPFVINDLEKFDDLIKPIGEWRAHSVDRLPIPELKLEDKVLCEDGIGVYRRSGDRVRDYRYHIEVLNKASWLKLEDYGGEWTSIYVHRYPRRQRAWMSTPEPYKVGVNEDGWFPCDKYLPPHQTRVLVTTENGEINITYYHKYAKEFANNTIGKIVAWRLLPGGTENVSDPWVKPKEGFCSFSDLSGIKGDVLLLIDYYGEIRIYRIVSIDSSFVWGKDINSSFPGEPIITWCATPDEYKRISVDEGDVIKFGTGVSKYFVDEVKFTAVRVKGIERLLGLEAKE